MDIATYTFGALQTYTDALLDAINAHPYGAEIKDEPAVRKAYDEYTLKVHEYFQHALAEKKAELEASNGTN